jgi:hypothetical protein
MELSVHLHASTALLKAKKLVRVEAVTLYTCILEVLSSNLG